MKFQKSMKVNKNQFLYDRWWRDIVFSLKQKNILGFLVNRMEWYFYPRFSLVKNKFPLHVDIETSNVCQMKCPMCYTISEKFTKNTNRRFIDWDLFVKIVDECAEANIFSIRLSWRGEPLMHPRILDMVKYAKEKGIRNVSLITNGLLLEEKITSKLIEYGLDYLNISMDGVGEKYDRIRKPSKYSEAIERVKNFQALKKEMGSSLPVIRVCSIWPAISDDPVGFYNNIAPFADKVVVNGYLDYENPRDIDPEFVCQYPWQRLNITVDGKAFPCPGDFFEINPVGDVNSERVIDIWHGKKLNQVREKHALGKRTDISACRDCHYGWVKPSHLDSRTWSPELGWLD